MRDPFQRERLHPDGVGSIRLIGVTGGIGSGKSLATLLLKEQGAVVFSADEAARAILTPNGPILQAIAREFGPDTLDAQGRLDRARLGQRIFADPDARRKLNALTHPFILRLLRAQIESARDDLPSGTVVAIEVPLLYEAGMQDWFDAVVVVGVSEETQQARLKARDQLDEAQVRARLASQWPLADKIARADYVLGNDGSPDALRQQVIALWERLHEVRLPQTSEGRAQAGP